MWILLKWIGIILGGVLILLIALIGVLVLRDSIRQYRRRRCLACGGREFEELAGVHVSGVEHSITYDLCVKCQKVWCDDSSEPRLMPCTEERAQWAKNEYAKWEEIRKRYIKVRTRRRAR